MLRALSIAPRSRHAARFSLACLFLGASLLISANAHAAKLTVGTSGSGAVTSSPGGINCGTTCSSSYASGTNVTLTASAATGYSFSGWGGACSGTSATCMVSVTAVRRVTATFSQNSYMLTVSKSGSGTVASSPGGITCGTTCSSSYVSGTSVTLTATAASGYSFSGWGGACSGTSASCTVSMTAARGVTATFSQTIVNYTLTVSNSGVGTVTSSPGGINCGTSCSAGFASGTSVTLTASAGADYSFSGWAGACSGTSATCTVAMTAARSVTATFSQNVAVTAPGTAFQCSGSGLAAIDLSGQCRVSAPTPGALEAVDPSTLPILVTWSPYAGTTSGYMIYYGPTSTTATNLASDVPIGTANFDPAAPAVSYLAQDLGLSPGSAVCFQVFAYDASHALYNWSEVQCTVA